MPAVERLYSLTVAGRGGSGYERYPEEWGATDKLTVVVRGGLVFLDSPHR